MPSTPFPLFYLVCTTDLFNQFWHPQNFNLVRGNWVNTGLYHQMYPWNEAVGYLKSYFWDCTDAATSVLRELNHAPSPQYSQLSFPYLNLPWFLWPVLALLCNHLHIKGVRTVRKGYQVHGNGVDGGGGGRESVNPNSGSHSKLLCIISMAVTCFLRMLPHSSLLAMFYVISSCVAQLPQTGVRKADGILLTQDKVI